MVTDSMFLNRINYTELNTQINNQKHKKNLRDWIVDCHATILSGLAKTDAVDV
jgi:hypothetical protein